MAGSAASGRMVGAVAEGARGGCVAAGLASWGAGIACWVDGGGGGETLLTVDRR